MWRRLLIKIKRAFERPYYHRKLKRLQGLEHQLSRLLYPAYDKDMRTLEALIRALLNDGTIRMSVFLGVIAEQMELRPEESLDLFTAFRKSVKPDVLANRMKLALKIDEEEKTEGIQDGGEKPGGEGQPSEP